MKRIFPLFLLLACDGGETSPTLEAPEIAGSYVDDFGSAHIITDTTWTMYDTTLFHFVEVDNEGDWLVAHNDPTNDYNPDQYSRMDWMDDGTTLWFCQTVYDAPDADTAATTAPADASDPAAGGCGGFPWSQLLVP